MECFFAESLQVPGTIPPARCVVHSVLHTVCAGTVRGVAAASRVGAVPSGCPSMRELSGRWIQAHPEGAIARLK